MCRTIAALSYIIHQLPLPSLLGEGSGERLFGEGSGGEASERQIVRILLYGERLAVL